MAPSSNYISFIFLTTLLLPPQITARDSQFFSKVTHFTNNVKETELPNNKEEPPLTNKPEEKQPEFIPEIENSYGLYGHDSDLPSTPTTTTTTTENTNPVPYTTTNNFQSHKPEFEDTSKYQHNNKYYNNDAYNNNNNYYNNDNYFNKDEEFEGNNQNELADTKYTEEGYNSMGNQKYFYNNNNNNNAASDRYFYNNENKNNYNTANNRYSYNHNANPNRYNGERQGMSDTRYLEGGKYFYDINYEKNNPSLYSDTSRGVNANNYLYNNRGNYYGNNNEYQNQEEFEEEPNVFDP